MEEDAKMLANRIALLKQEDIRTRKRAEEARKKSKSIIGKRQDVEQRIAQVNSPQKIENQQKRKE